MKHILITRRFLILLTAAALLFAAPVRAADKTPPLPAPLQNLVAEGAQMRYLGNTYGLDGWIAVQSGQEQYFYVTPKGDAFVMGLLFDGQGKMQTMRQVADLQKDGSAGDLGLFAGTDLEPSPLTEKSSRPEFKTPSEQLFDDVSQSNWVPLGETGAPVIYSFVDPLCPFCHALIDDLRANYIDTGKIQVRMIPVGFKEGSMERAAFLLAVPSPQERWYRYLAGDNDALPVTPGINEQGVQRNMAIMQSWKLNVTPLTVYRAKSGEVKIVQGRVRDVAALVADLAPAGSETPNSAGVQ